MAKLEVQHFFWRRVERHEGDTREVNRQFANRYLVSVQKQQFNTVTP